MVIVEEKSLTGFLLLDRRSQSSNISVNLSVLVIVKKNSFCLLPFASCLTSVRSLFIASIIICIYLVGCNSFLPAQSPLTESQKIPTSQTSSQEVTVDESFKVVAGQTIYVSVYSHIYHEKQRRPLYLATNLSIRNTDLANSVIITMINYYNSQGQLINSFLARPIKIKALESINFFVDSTDTMGGLGANFIVKWIAEKSITEPIVETVMISTRSGQGISFICQGKVIKTVNSD